MESASSLPSVRTRLLLLSWGQAQGYTCPSAIVLFVLPLFWPSYFQLKGVLNLLTALCLKLFTSSHVWSVALFLPCLHPIHLSHSVHGLLHWVLPEFGVATAATPKQLDSCASCFRCLLCYLETGLSPKTQRLCSQLTDLCIYQHFMPCTMSRISHMLYLQTSQSLCSESYRIPLQTVFPRCLVAGLTASNASTQHGLQYVLPAKLLVCFKNVL